MGHATLVAAGSAMSASVHKYMLNFRRNAILEVYQLVLAIFLFVSPWLFAFAQGTLRVDAWIGAALVFAISFAALVAFREWEEWINCILGLWIAASP